jgi:hypothetical protein
MRDDHQPELRPCSTSAAGRPPPEVYMNEMDDIPDKRNADFPTKVNS